jgi:hypothetical protein
MRTFARTGPHGSHRTSPHSFDRPELARTTNTSRRNGRRRGSSGEILNADQSHQHHIRTGRHARCPVRGDIAPIRHCDELTWTTGLFEFTGRPSLQA